MNPNLLKIDDKDSIAVSLDQIVGRHIVVLGLSGSGKSNTVAVLVEEALSRQYPVTIIDVEGEYWGLREQYPILVVGRSANVDRAVSPYSGAQLANWVFDKNIPIILDVLNFNDEEREQFLADYVETFWKRVMIQPRPHLLVVEEAHMLIPQQGKATRLRNAIQHIATRGRKRGLGLLVATQRPSMIHKNVITQAGAMFLHRNTYPNEIKVYQEILPIEPSIVKKDVPEMLPGQAFFVFDHKPRRITVRRRHTFDGGATPLLGESRVTPDVRPADQNLISELQGLALASESAENEAESAAQKTIATLNSTIADLQQEIEHLREQLALERARPHQASPEEGQQREQTDDQFTAVLKGRSQKKFSAFLERFRAADLYDRATVAFLISEADKGREWPLPDIAKHIGVGEKDLSDKPPLTYVDRLVTRRRKEHGRYYYKSCHEAFFKREFPLLDAEELKASILRVAAQTMVGRR